MREVDVAQGAFSRGEPLPAWVEPLPVAPGDPARRVHVRLADTHLYAGDTQVHFESHAVQVNDASALGMIGQYQLLFIPDYQKLKLHSVRLLRGEESLDITQTVNVRFLQRETGLEQGMYSGAVTAVLLVEDVRAGDTLHVMYSIEGHNPVFGDRYAVFSNWDDVHPVKLRRVSLLYPARRAIRWRMLGEATRAAPAPEAGERNGMRLLRFTGRDLAAVEPEPQLPPDFLLYGYLQFSEYADWNEVARWAAALFEPATRLPPEALALVERLRKLPTREARISAALQWVQSEIRYFSVSLGQSSHRPHPPELVLRRRYGDCKDKSLLLVSLLRQLGVEARPVLALANARRMPGKFLPTPFAFDHVIVEVNDGRAFYLDPTRLGQSGRLSAMGQALEGAEVLVVSPDTTGLVRIASPNVAELVRSGVEERISLTSLAGEGTVELRRTYHGVQAETLRVLRPQLGPANLRNLALRGLERRYPDAAWLEEPRLQDDAEANRIVVTARFHSKRIGAAEPQRWRVALHAANFVGIYPMPDAVRRSLPLAVPAHPFEGRYSVEIVWPQNVSAMRDPFHRKIENRYFVFEGSGTFRGNRAKYEFVFRTLADAVEAPDYRAVTDAMRELNRLAYGAIVVGAGEVTQTIRLGKTRTLQESLQERLQAMVEGASRTIRGGQVAGADLAEALCTRAEALADLGRIRAAQADANEAVRLAPGLARAYECRAQVSFAAGEFSAAAADFSRARALGDTGARSLYRRGQARFYMDRLEEAAQDFAAAAAKRAHDSEAIHAELWLAWTLKRLGRGLPREIVERVRQDPRGAWPRPALAMLAGVLTPEEMLREAERLHGDEREMALAEAWFYLGQELLSRNEAASAKEAFEKARAKGVIVYIEHVAAGFELQRMQAAAGATRPPGKAYSQSN